MSQDLVFILVRINLATEVKAACVLLVQNK